MGMTWEQWEQIAARLSASYPDQPINAATANEWYDELAHLEAGDIWLAIRRLRREHHFRPNLAEIMVACKIQRVEMAEQADRQRRRAAQGWGSGTPMPPETRQALEILKETLRPETPRQQKAEAKAMIEALAAQLNERHPARDEERTSA